MIDFKKLPRTISTELKQIQQGFEEYLWCLEVSWITR